MITADDTSADRELALTGGADRFIGKPFSIAAINSVVDSLIN